MRARLNIFAILWIASISALTPAWGQTTLTWSGGAATDWNTAANWTPHQVPTALDHVIIASGNVTVPASGVFNVMDWMGGDLSGAINVASGHVLNIGGNVLLDAAITNSGTINWTNGSINMAYNVNTAGPIINQPGATWNISCDNYISTESTAGYPFYSNAYIVNSGLLRKTAGTGVTQIGFGVSYAVQFRNSGTVETDAGTINFEGGGPISGTYTAGAGTTIQFGHGSYTVTNATLSATGTIEFTGDNLTLTSDILSNLKLLSGNVLLGPGFQGGSITNLTIAGSTLKGSYVLSGVMNWTSGFVNGVLTVSSGGTLNINGTVNLDAALTNSGVVNWISGDINMAYNNSSAGPIINQPGGSWNISGNNYLATQSSVGYPTETNAYFVNNGLLRKTAGSGTTQVGFGGAYAVAFRNNGTAESDSGVLSFESGGLISATYTANAGGTINFHKGNFVAGDVSMGGAGTIEFTGDNLTLSNSVPAKLQLVSGTLALGPAFEGGTITNLTLAGVTLSGNYTVAGVLNWNTGDIKGSISVATNGALNINGDILLDAAITNAGTVNWTAGNVNMAYNVTMAGPIVNLSGATWNIQCDKYLSTESSPGYPVETNAYFLNYGLIRKTAGTGTTQLSLHDGYVIYLQNFGTLEVDAGTLSIEGGGWISGTNTTTGSGIIRFTYGVFPVTQFAVVGTNVQFNGDTLILSNNVVPGLKMLSGKVALGPLFQGGSVTNLTLASSILSGNYNITGVFNCGAGTTGNLTVAGGGFMNWTGGDIVGSLIVSNNALMNFAGTLSLDAALTNYGTINWTNGNVNMAYTVNSGGPFVIEPGGIWNIQCDGFFDANYAAGYPTYSNAYIANFGLVRKTANFGITEIGYHGAYPVLFKNSGTVESDAGTINFEGGYQDNGAGHVAFAPAGLASTNYGTINFNTKPALSGALNFSLLTRNGFQYAAGQHFQVLTFPASTNWFPYIGGLDLGNGLLFEPLLTATNLSLLGITYSNNLTVPKLFIVPSSGGMSVSWQGNFPGWTLETTTNLSPPSWQPVSGFQNNAVVVPNNGSRQFFRLSQ